MPWELVGEYPGVEPTRLLETALDVVSRMRRDGRGHPHYLQEAEEKVRVRLRLPPAEED
jgi:hypothetical protein